MRVFISILLISFSFSTYAQFPSLNWQYDIGAPAFGSASAADLDDDGFYEIVFTTYTADGRAHCLNAEDGSVLWTYNLGGCGDVAPLIYDLDGDDTLDVFIVGSCNPTAWCINGHTGKLKYSIPSGGGDSPPTVADIDGDNKPEVLFGNFNGQIRIINGEDGSVNKIIQADPTGGTVQTAPTLLDVNNDNVLDIIVANYFITDAIYVWCYDYITEDTIWTYKVPDSTSNIATYHAGAVADIDLDGIEEYVIGSGNGTIFAINTEDGSELWTTNIPSSNLGALSIADLDNDSVPEIAYSNNDAVTFDQRIGVLSGLDGSLEWSMPTTFSAFRGVAISDLNGNGQLDLVSGHFMGTVYAVEPYNGTVWTHNLYTNYFPQNLPYFDADHGPLIADFDQNGMIDVFMTGGYGTYIPDSLNTGKAFMLEAGLGNGCPEWLMFRHDVKRTGYLTPAEVADTSCGLVFSSVDGRDGSLVFDLFPNPVSTNLILEFPERNNYEIEVYTYTGKLIHRIRVSDNEYILDVSHMEQGIYLVRLISEDGIGTKRFIR